MSDKGVIIEFDDEMGAYLDQLVEIGLYGSSRAEAVGHLLADGLKGALRDGIIRSNLLRPLALPDAEACEPAPTTD